MSAPDAPEIIAAQQLSPSQLAEMVPFGSERTTAAGDLLFEAGEASYDLFVVLEGEVEVLQSEGSTETVVASFRPGTFIGGSRC